MPERPSITIFTPSPEQAAQILTALADPDLTLNDIAHDHGATLDALTLWLARGDIAERLGAMEQLAARRARLVATSHLATVAAAMARLIQDTDDECAHVPVNPKSLPALEQRRRTRETARRAASLLLRLARFTPVPLAARPPVLRPSRSSLSSSSDLFRPLSPWERPGEGSCFCLPSSTRLPDSSSPSSSDLSSPPSLPIYLPSAPDHTATSIDFTPAALLPLHTILLTPDPHPQQPASPSLSTTPPPSRAPPPHPAAT